MKSLLLWIKSIFRSSSTPEADPRDTEYYENMGVKLPVGVSAHIDPVLSMDRTPKPPEIISFQEKLWAIELKDGSLFRMQDASAETKLTATVLKYIFSHIDADKAALLQVTIPDPVKFPETTQFISISNHRRLHNFQGWNSREYEIVKRFEFGDRAASEEMKKEGLIGPETKKVAEFPLNYSYKKWLMEKGMLEILKEFKNIWEFSTRDLELAANKGNEDLVDFLLRAIDTKDHAGVIKLNLNQYKYAFLKAVENKHFECANMIFPFVDYFDITRYLRDAVRNKEEDKARYLLKVMVFMEDLNQVHHSMLFMATQEEDYWIRNALEIVEPEFRPSYMVASIGKACERKELIGSTKESEIAHFEKKQITPENKLNTPLVDAAENGLSTLVEERIPGADTKSLNTALCRAIKEGYLGIVKILIENGADPFCYRGLPEKHAVNYGRVRIGEYLQQVIQSRRN